VDEDLARRIARIVIGPAGALGYLVGRGQWWPNEAVLKNGKVGIAHVMGAAYDLLVPVWRLHPQLDPAQVQDALGLAKRTLPLDDSPKDLCGLLAEMDAAAAEVLPALVAEFPSQEAQLRMGVAELMDATSEAVRIIREAGAVIK
jgi:hypothetical protein